MEDGRWSVRRGRRTRRARRTRSPLHPRSADADKGTDGTLDQTAAGRARVWSVCVTGRLSSPRETVAGGNGSDDSGGRVWRVRPDAHATILGRATAGQRGWKMEDGR